MLNDIIQIAAENWVNAFQKSPKLTSIISIIALVIIGAITHTAIEADRAKQELKRLESNNYQTQINQLNDTEKNIKQLLDFVKNQQASLREVEDSISKLKTEKEQLQPLVEMNKDAVDALFRAQEERANSNVWRERIIGFGIGVVASLLASFFWHIATISFSNRKQPTQSNHP